MTTIQLTKEGAQEVAATIKAQLGGPRFAVMTGAKNFFSLPEGGLQFSLPSNFAKGGINKVIITLTVSDEYDVTFGKLRGMNWSVVEEARGIHAEDLRRLFTDCTGLDTSL